MKNYLFYLVFTVVTVCYSSVNAQDWSLYKTVNGVEIYYAEQSCEMSKGYDQLRMLFKYVNTTDSLVQISFDQEIYYDGRCINCDKIGSEEYHQEFVLKPKTTKAGTCALNEKQANYLMIRFIGVRGKQSELTQFELRNINVKPIANDEE